MAPPSAVIFDLDGTLVDTLDDLADAMNGVLRERGLPPHDRDAYRWLVGSGVEALVRGATPPSAQNDLATLVREFRQRYGAHMFDRSKPYEGVPELLEALQARGAPMAVLSNKPDEPTRTMVRRLFGDVGFREVRGKRPDMPAKPSPEPALALARVMGVPPGDVAFLGDTRIDMETARAASMVPIGALWGFRDRQELEAHGAQRVIAHPRDLLTVVR